jgi:hypothetical protein
MAPKGRSSGKGGGKNKGGKKNQKQTQKDSTGGEAVRVSLVSPLSMFKDTY